MTRPGSIVPFIMGSGMGAMMLWMAHGAMIDGTTPRALIVFATLHLTVIGVFVGASYWAARCAPSLRARLNRLHRPSRAHFLMMLGSAAVTALTVHLFIHRGL